MSGCGPTTPTPPPAAGGDPSRELSAWTQATDQTPAGVDMERPSAARMYDYYLGSSYNFAADRHAAQAAIAAAPRMVATAWANRDFARRAVRYAVDEGVGQFLDLGAGLPVRGGIHELVRATLPAAPVVYIDNDPIIVAVAYTIVEGDPACAAVRADIRDLARILDAPYTRARIDFAQPVCVVLTAVLHYLPGDLADLMSALRDHLCAGSLLVISHATEPEPESKYAAQTDAVREIYARTSTPLTLRSPEQIAALFAGFDLVAADRAEQHTVPPALVPVNQWRPHVPADEAVPEAPLAGLLAGVGRKPPHRISTGRPPRPTNRMPTDVTTPTRPRQRTVRGPAAVAALSVAAIATAAVFPTLATTTTAVQPQSPVPPARPQTASTAEPRKPC
jgi:hypothetical protein